MPALMPRGAAYRICGRFRRPLPIVEHNIGKGRRKRERVYLIVPVLSRVVGLTAVGVGSTVVIKTVPLL